jgi:hypothetical protein
MITAEVRHHAQHAYLQHPEDGGVFALLHGVAVAHRTAQGVHPAHLHERHIAGDRHPRSQRGRRRPDRPFVEPGRPPRDGGDGESGHGHEGEEHEHRQTVPDRIAAESLGDRRRPDGSRRDRLDTQDEGSRSFQGRSVAWDATAASRATGDSVISFPGPVQPCMRVHGVGMWWWGRIRRHPTKCCPKRNPNHEAPSPGLPCRAVGAGARRNSPSEGGYCMISSSRNRSDASSLRSPASLVHR